ncbi:BLUF domain-containing protein [Paracoccus liaowanqingii]|uniref:BLUF domain-containing protein n=1 Tax=Paracoccus liaowanqingii TaxID=2560053 RepID=A0A4Z1CFK5_9RHOB|nr:BLUF domain-containing protein [Paracoccus liaowanqingii]TGN55603.1 BLUF domain-containing protein [Paracoccus liaowanqingii]
MQLTRLIYVSNHSGIEDTSLEAILEKSKINNKIDDITGLLICSGEDFIQLIEEGRTVVAKCFMRIMQDERHRDIRIVFSKPVDSRLFPEWNMQNVSASQIRKEPLNKYWINGLFEPDEMSHEDIEELFIFLSGEVNNS